MTIVIVIVIVVVIVIVIIAIGNNYPTNTYNSHYKEKKYSINRQTKYFDQLSGPLLCFQSVWVPYIWFGG